MAKTYAVKQKIVRPFQRNYSIHKDRMRCKADKMKTQKKVYIYLILSFLATVLFSFHTLPVYAQETKHVLLLNSYHKGYPWTDEIVEGIHSVFDKAEDFSIVL